MTDIDQTTQTEAAVTTTDVTATAAIAGEATVVETASATTVKPRNIKARVLMACLHGQPDEVVTLAPDVAKVAEAAGQVDTNKAAVAYALSLQ
jgi:hypothetical protein